MTKPCSILAILLIATTCVVAQQANVTGTASMVIGGVGAAPAVGPFQIPIASGPSNTTVTMTMNGPANTPWILANSNPGLGGFMSFAGGTPTPYGFLDIQPLALPPIEIVVDGLGGLDPILRALANTGSTGTASYPLTFLAPPCPAVQANLQGMLPTVGPPGFQFTAAYQIATGTVLPDAAPVAVTGAGDDTSTLYNFAGCGGFDFYGVIRGAWRANSNGNITFGASFTGLGESQATFNSHAGGMIAPFWDDLNLNTGGTFMKFDNGTFASLSWNAVPEFSLGGANTVNVTMVRASGDIVITYGACSLLDAITGITPGGSTASPVTVFGLTAVNGRLSSHLGGGPAYFGAAGESMNELFVTTPTATAGNFNLAGATMTFLKTGVNSYTMF
jgi:hypothetical protein